MNPARVAERRFLPRLVTQNLRQLVLTPMRRSFPAKLLGDVPQDEDGLVVSQKGWKFMPQASEGYLLVFWRSILLHVVIFLLPTLINLQKIHGGDVRTALAQRLVANALEEFRRICAVIVLIINNHCMCMARPGRLLTSLAAPSNLRLCRRPGCLRLQQGRVFKHWALRNPASRSQTVWFCKDLPCETGQQAHTSLKHGHSFFS
mmetsp:Transcript_36371/g.67708  ORF Transcript_36371/g.67708 Transcript_36371/m.67708 type:complete len:204 (+) Transcript_36371:793-1404(+)